MGFFLYLRDYFVHGDTEFDFEKMKQDRIDNKKAKDGKGSCLYIFRSAMRTNSYYDKQATQPSAELHPLSCKWISS